MSKYSKIVVGGCSFTDKNFPKYAQPKPLDFKMWPELIAEKTGKEVINTAKSASGNRRIYQTVLNELVKHEDVEQVIIGWSEWTRQDFLVKDGGQKDGWHSLVPRKKDEKDKITKVKVIEEDVLFDFYMNAFNFDYPRPSQIVDENLNQFYSLQCICKARNIKLKMFQMFYPINNFFSSEQWEQPHATVQHELYTKTFIQHVLKHPLLLEMDNTFWGWPVFEDIGGIDLSQYFKKRNMWRRVSHLDAHPDEETHKNIAKLIQENL